MDDMPDRIWAWTKGYCEGYSDLHCCGEDERKAVSDNRKGAYTEYLRSTPEREHAGEMREALKLCKKALYDAVHRADVKNMPEYAADAIQQTQYVLETIAAEERKNNDK